MSEEEAPIKTSEHDPEAAKAALEKMAGGEEILSGYKEALDEGKVAPPPEGAVDGLRAFIAPNELNSTFLVRAGEPYRPPSMSGFGGAGLIPLMGREGDLTIRFTGGICVTDDPELIEWCEAHGPDSDLHRRYHEERDQDPRGCGVGSGLCRDASDPMTEIWAEFRAQQIPNARRDATISPGIDIDKALTRGMRGITAAGEGKRLQESVEAATAAERGRRG